MHLANFIAAAVYGYSHGRNMGHISDISEGRMTAGEGFVVPGAMGARMRAIEFDATDPGDWALHCHKSHTMNAMGLDVPTTILRIKT
jgi:hypothetical protein